ELGHGKIIETVHILCGGTMVPSTRSPCGSAPWLTSVLISAPRPGAGGSRQSLSRALSAAYQPPASCVHASRFLPPLRRASHALRRGLRAVRRCARPLSGYWCSAATSIRPPSTTYEAPVT